MFRERNGLHYVIFRNSQVFGLPAYLFGGMELYGSEDDFSVIGVAHGRFNQCFLSASLVSPALHKQNI
jgi:hypothetical protein